MSTTEVVKFESTYDKLQKHLQGTLVDLCGCTFKGSVPHVACKDGTTLSVQGSSSHWCSPREDIGPYDKVEVWCIRKDGVELTEISEFPYSVEEPSAYVPIEDVILFIDNCGGFKE